jgi:hypothetical protein
VTPFLSYGGSAMAANFAALGMLMAIGAHRGGARAPSRFACRCATLRAGLVLPALCWPAC